ncbi:hypothetical protein [Lacisediminihabitans profunda]|uniref:hypothetical protein n=1 Tax=Lacisediminihabitans profunda TaxID=2594790 RepID=UPI001FE88321|nr:hypothetical protein [Lacisediminihabitans profunda]
MTGIAARAAVATCLVVALAGIGAARVPAAEAAVCIPLVTQCGPATPSPAPAPGPAPTPIVPLPGPGGAPDTAPPVAALADPDAPTFTVPAAQLGGSSITIEGLHSVTAVTVPLANGTRTPVLKIVADDVVVDDFMLDVRKATGPSLVTSATRMHLHGNVRIYLDSITGSLLDGTALTLGATTPPPGNELPPTLLRVNLGLVGVTAASIVFTSPHQSLKG